MQSRVSVVLERMGMNINLTPQLKKWCDRRLHWFYTSASEVVREALRLMEEKDQVLDKLFQPFNRLGRETGSEEGTSIGLVVTKKLVEFMGGKIGVESVVSAGSTFWVDLPSAKPPFNQK